MDRNVINNLPRADMRNNATESEGVPVWKTVAVVAVVIGCFAAVYPKMMHPIIMHALGGGDGGRGNGLSDEDIRPPRPMGTPPGGRSHGPDFHPHNGPPPPLRMGPHPGAQMDGTGQYKGSSKAMWHWMLPFYTVGVIVFLLYTLGKIFFTQSNRNDQHHQRPLNFNYNASSERFELSNRNGTKGYNDIDIPGNLSDRELRRLQVRLQETETAMHKILSQLEKLSGTVDPAAADDLKRMTVETLNSIGSQTDSEKLTENFQQDDDNNENGQKTYMKDLDNALNDFKKFTEDYIEEHTKNKAYKNQAQSSVNVDTIEKDEGDNKLENDKGDDRLFDSVDEESDPGREKLGFDAMEAEKCSSGDHLKLENGEGIVIDVSGDSGAHNSGILLRKRVINSEAKAE